MATELSDAQSSGDYLSIILDLNPLAWAQSEEANDSLSLEEALKCLLLFCNAHLSLRNENELVVYGAGPGRSELLYSSLDRVEPDDEGAPDDGSTYQEFRLVDQQIARGARAMLSQGDVPVNKPLNLVGALARSLCHASAQYISMMNCIFSAQKAGIPIDVCKIHGEDAVFLQQAAFLTNGLYYRLERRAGLLQYLMMAFLPGRLSRKHLNLPHQDQVDLRAACFCHRKIVDIGFVCSVCLSIFCSPVPQCTTCKTSFPLASLKRLAGTRGSLKR